MSPGSGAGALRARAETGVCVGAGQCARVAPALFDQHDDGTVRLLRADVPAEARDDLLLAVDLCPSGALGAEEPA
ncbi:ferredoxin [Marinactinospora thermotolerans]|uniref:ferredoxin n=1 Tax=Marinactinospora thermotolerans TaxID=531310 RepID=UPI001F37D61C|nr:ferredoxin [Marinactinospora thermotolerans]